jgi:hypothetical protein
MKGIAMVLHKLMGCSAAAIISVGAIFTTVVPMQAAVLHAGVYAPTDIRHVDCAVGAHIGPVGGCILGADDPHPVVVEHHDDNVGCETKSVTRQDAAGNTETKTKTNC